MTEPAAPPKRRIGLLIWMIVSQLLAIGSLLIWAYLAGMSVMAFDSGESREAWTIVLTVWAYPLFPLLMAIGAWVAFGFRKNRLAAVLTGLTIAPPVLLLLLVWVMDLIGPP
jgi:hypothetical protein